MLLYSGFLFAFHIGTQDANKIHKEIIHFIEHFVLLFIDEFLFILLLLENAILKFPIKEMALKTSPFIEEKFFFSQVANYRRMNKRET